jgi:hypothetical protein
MWVELEDWVLALSRQKRWFSGAEDCCQYWDVEYFRLIASAKNVDGWRPCQQAALACGIKDVLVHHGWRWYNHGKSVVSDDRILPFGRAGRALLCLGAPVHNASTVSCVFFGFFGVE